MIIILKQKSYPTRTSNFDKRFYICSWFNRYILSRMLKTRKITIRVTFLLATILCLQQFYVVILTDSKYELQYIVNVPFDCETGEDISEKDVKEYKFSSREQIELSQLTGSLLDVNIHPYISRIQDVHLDVLTPPPEC